MRTIPPTLLFVEDSDLLRQVVTDELAEAGLSVLAAATGEMALAALARRAAAIDWLFTDIRLPGAVDGWAVADAFRRLHPNGPVVFATGDLASGSRDYADSLFLRKPYRVAEVVQAFRRLEAGWVHETPEVAALRRLGPCPTAPV